MPYSGWDPQQPGAPPSAIDPTGHSLDPSTYYALSSGGRFPGDVWAYLEGQAAMDPSADRSGNRANPDYNLPAWLERVPGRMGNIIARLVRGHEWNVRNNNDAALPNPLEAGNPYQGWSGPGARYGPEGGPLHGTLDQGSDHLGDFDYGIWPDGPNAPANNNRRRRGGGGGDFGPLNFQPYGGTPHQSQFVDYQPIAPFSVDNSPTRMVPGRGGTPVGGTPVGGGGVGQPAVPTPGGGRGERPRPNGQPSGRGAGASTPPAGAGGRPRGGAGAGTSPFSGNLPPELVELLMGDGSPVLPPLRDRADFHTGQHGFDVGYTFRGTPGWTTDPTTGILNTAGMPRATPPSRGMFSTDDEYITALHDLGWDNESIIGLMNDWGTGGIVRGPEGYMFANDPRAQESAGWPAYRPDDLWVGGGYPAGPALGGGGASTDAPRAYVPTGGGGGGMGNNPESASAMLSAGWSPHVMWR